MTRIETGFKANIEFSAFLPHLAQPIGWLILKGWFFPLGKTTKTGVSISIRNAQEKCFTQIIETTLPRPDVKAVYPEAPLNSGFEILIPGVGLDIMETGLQVGLQTKDRKAVSLFHSIIDLGSKSVRSAMVKDDNLRLRKLNNLIVNEQERLGRNAIKKSNPISLYIEPSFACNLSCPHCISNHLRSTGFHRPALDMNLLDDILRAYGDTAIKVTLAMWGEPFLHKRFPEIVQKISSYGIMTECSTNLAIPMSDKRIEEIVSSGLQAIRLSVDGAHQETYQKYRVGGSLQEVIRNMRKLVETKRHLGMKTPYLQWQFLDFPWNQHERETARQMAFDIGVDGFNHFPGDFWQAEQEKRDRNEADDFIVLSDALKAQLSSNDSQKSTPHRHQGCDFLDHCIAINSDGVVHPCCYVVEPKASVGQWQNGDRNMFNAPLLQKLRHFINNASHSEYGPIPCSECGALAARGHVKDQISFIEAFTYLTQSH